MRKVELIMVTAENNNKFYRMEELGDGNFKAEYGRVGGHTSTRTYSMGQWNSKYNSKIKKGYTDVTDYQTVTDTVAMVFPDDGVKELYNMLMRYTSDNISNNYTVKVGAVTQSMVEDAQDLINQFTLKPSDELLIQLFRVLPRKMGQVSHYLLDSDGKGANRIIEREQNLLDSMSSGVIANTVVEGDFQKTFGITINEVTPPKEVYDLFVPTNSSKYRIKKCFAVLDPVRQKQFDDHVRSVPNKSRRLLIHGTRNPNVLKILKSGLILRPTNVHISGKAYGEGIYHSFHTDKSINYTGHDSDKVFFLQDVHMGKHYTYEGWYRKGKDLDRSDMSKKGLAKLGYDSLYVKPGDGLRNSEYIVYDEVQTTVKYLLWLN